MRVTAAIVCGILAVSIGVASAAPVAPSTVRIGIADGGAQPDADVFNQASLTPDGRYVVFASDSPSLAAGTAGGSGFFLYLRDRQLGTTELVNRAADGGAPNASVFANLGAPVLSADGRYVAFSSRATNLVPGDANGHADVFVRDRVMQTTRRVSIGMDGAESNGDSINPSIAADGSVVVFQSQASNLVPDDATFGADIFAFDLHSGTTSLVSAAVGGGPANGSSTVTSGAVSADGRRVVFSSLAGNLVDLDANGGKSDVFLRDLQTGTTEVASRTSDGAQVTAATVNGFVSADGRHVAFQCGEPCSVLPGAQPATAIFVRDRVTGTVQEATLSSADEEARSSTFVAGFGPDGRHVAFATNAGNLLPFTPYAVFDLYVRDLDTHTTERVSVSTAGDPANDSSFTGGQILSAGGRFVLVSSTATNLVVGDTNGKRDLFLRDRGGEDAPPPPVDTDPPAITCQQPAPVWHGSNVTVACTASDAGSGLASDSDSSFSLSTFVPSGTSTMGATTDARLVCDNAGNCASAGPVGGIMVDRARPEIVCDAADEVWHGGNALAHCTASDGGSGLADPALASFFLSTHVAAGTDDASATTDTRDVCDAVGNCATAGPVPGFRVDLTLPDVVCEQPDDQWHADNVTFACTVADTGAGLSSSSSVSLTTMQADGVEGQTWTGVQLVCDAVGNCLFAGPIGPALVDRKDPIVGLPQFTPAPNVEGWNNTPVTVSWTCSDGGSGPVAAVVTEVLGEGASQHPTGTCTDRVGRFVSETSLPEANVDLTAPLAALAAPAVVHVGTPIVLDATAFDALSGVTDGELFIGADPGVGQATPLGFIGGQAEATPPGPTSPALLTPCVRSRDRAGNWSVAACAVVAVYDQAAGRMNGSGTAVVPDGGAQLHVDSRYVGKSAAPTGAVRFRIAATHLDFRATSQQWLVVRGARADVRGVGRLDGIGGYAFQASVLDGDKPGGDGVDRFRFRIWHPDGHLVYDSRPGAAVDAQPVTPLAHGSIAIR